MHREPAGLIDRTISGIERAGQLYTAGKTIWDVGRAIGTVARVAGPLLLA